VRSPRHRHGAYRIVSGGQHPQTHGGRCPLSRAYQDQHTCRKPTHSQNFLMHRAALHLRHMVLHLDAAHFADQTHGTDRPRVPQAGH